MVADDEVERCRARSEEENPNTCSSVQTDSEPSLIRPAVGVKNLAPAPACAILGVPLCQSRGWRPTLLQPLPSDFLRLERGPRSPRHPVSRNASFHWLNMLAFKSFQTNCLVV